MNRSIIGLIMICLFALPFAGFGIFALSRVIEEIQTGTGDGQIWLGLLFGIVFTGIGVGLILLAVYSRRLTQRQQSVQAQFPGQPWNWRADWASGRINSNVRSSTVGAWIMALLWNLASSPLYWIVPHEAPRRGPIVLIGFIFPVVGVYLLIRAVRLSLELHEFGRTYFQMDSVPGVVGRELKGTIHLRFPHTPDHGIQLRLSCVNRVVTGSGNSSSTSEKILWRGESTVASGQIYPGPAETIIPVSFHIPWAARPTEKIDPRNSILWLLEARAEVPGVDYDDAFEVPVFHTEQSPNEAQARADEAVEQPITARPEVCTVRVQQTAEGTEFYFPAARNKGFAFSTSMFAGLFGSTTLFILHMRAPIIFPLGFGFFTLLLLYISLQMWLETTRVTIGNSGLIFRDGWLGGGKSRQIARADISAIDCRITAQQGGSTGTPYYDIELRQKDGSKVTLGHSLRDKQETEWLVQEMRRLSGLQQASTAKGAHY
jgi:hypothetical protein